MRAVTVEWRSVCCADTASLVFGSVLVISVTRLMARVVPVSVRSVLIDLLCGALLVAATRSFAAVCVLCASQRMFPPRVDFVATLAEWSVFVAQRVVAIRHGCFASRVRSRPKRVPCRSARVVGSRLGVCVRCVAMHRHRITLRSIDVVKDVTRVGFVGRVVAWQLLLRQYLVLLVMLAWRRGARLVAIILRFAVVCV